MDTNTFNSLSTTYDYGWFSKRGMETRIYQYTAIMTMIKLINEKKVSVLAACPGAGKTLMSIYLIEKYLEANPTHHALVLAHGQSVLREQFNEDVEDYEPNFTYNNVVSKRDFDKSKQVWIGIPQSISKINFSSFKNVFIVVDEAHQFYRGKEVQTIIENIHVTRTLCLTGTPSKFIREGIDCSFTVICDIMDSGAIAPMTINVVSSNYNFKVKPFQNNEDEEGESSDVEDTNDALDKVLKGIHKLLKSHRNSNFTNALPTLQKLGKTMIACNSQKQAMQVKAYFEKLGISVELSISNEKENTPDYDAIKRFKKESEKLILIVVQRGVLGFNYPPLINVVDMTLSHNIDRIYQLLSRGIRSFKKERKFFFKIAPSENRTYYEYIMNAVLSMCTYEFYTKFNGKNLDQVSIGVIRRRIEPTTNDEPREQRTPRERGAIRPIPIMNLDLEDYIKGVYHTGKKACEVYGTATLQEVKDSYDFAVQFSIEEIAKSMGK